MTWEGVMPRAGEVDAAYLDALAAPVDLLHAEGIYVLLDMHQDVRARCFCCDGAPEWAIRDEGEPFTPQAQWFLNDFLPAVKRSFDLFRAGDRGAHPDLQVHFAAAWQAVARRFRGHPGVIGYDQFNEPSPGSKTDVGERLGRPNTDGPSPAFDREDLFPLYQRVIDAIRVEDADRWLFVEPRYGAPGNGLPSDHEALHDPRPGDARLVYAPSLYSLACERDARYEPDRDHTVTRWEGARTEELSRAPTALVLGEWGFDWTFPRADLCGRNVMAMADRLRAGWAYWSDSTGTWGLIDETGAERPAANAVVCPYPRATIPPVSTYASRPSGAGPTTRTGSACTSRPCRRTWRPTRWSSSRSSPANRDATPRDGLPPGRSEGRRQAPSTTADPSGMC
jgi:endoglycosylceramidase